MKKRLLLIIGIICIFIISMSVSKEYKVKKKNDNKDNIGISEVLVNGKINNDIISKDGLSLLYIVNDKFMENDSVIIDYNITNKSNNSYFINMECETSNKYKSYYVIDNNYIDSIGSNSNITGKFILKVISKEEITLKEIIMCKLNYIKK